MQKILLWMIAISQLVLAFFTLFLPITFYEMMGLGVPSVDNGYMIGMLGARFLAYGIGMAWLAQQSQPSRFWLANMLLIQAVDFTLGAAYMAMGIVSFSVVVFPMFNASVFIIGLTLALYSKRFSYQVPA